MTPELSQELGQILGAANPPPTLDERQSIINAAQEFDTIDAMPAKIRRLIDELRRRRYARTVPMRPTR